ncbi:MAG: hypothetical protein D6748_01480 [Calditrichaeota bacterium]|nr:MAG: hypothetical protein D6748_01480 [Calditrichota bacterium]
MGKNEKKTLPILYKDEHIVAIDKPAGIHVHPTRLSPGEDSCMRILRDQLNQWVYPVHRLDRATSGVVVFALSSDVARKLQNLFNSRTVKKYYLAVVRGWVPEKGEISAPLKENKTKEQVEAITKYIRLGKIDLPVAVGKFPSARYSLVWITPITGRMHQIRKHFVHLRHPIIGDVQYGDGKHNRLFREEFGLHRLLLMAVALEFPHPVNDSLLTIQSPIPDDVMSFFQKVGWDMKVKNMLETLKRNDASLMG